MLAGSIRITLVALFFLWMCKEGALADMMSFEALLGQRFEAGLGGNWGRGNKKQLRIEIWSPERTSNF